MAGEDTKREQIRSVRDRLYDRSFSPRQSERTKLEKEGSTEEAPHAWGNEPLRPMTPLSEDKEFQSTMKKRKKHYRSILVLFGLLFFLVAAGFSGVYLYFGGNTISNENISVSIDGPSSVGGGEVIDLMIEVSNQNTAPLQAATLNVRFPNGTQSPDEEGKELLRETIALETVESGEVVTIPVRAQLFGEEDEEKQISVEMEYRLQGSNGTFKANTDPHIVKINSSPVSIVIKSLEQVSSGQATDVELVVRSNSPTTLHNLIVKAEYPYGFDFTGSKPAPVSGQNVWIVNELKPNEESSIEIKGLVTGLPSDERVIRASVGVSDQEDSYDLVSVFSADDFEYAIEQQFVNFDITINRQSGETVVIEEGTAVNVDIDFTNPLENTLYDAEVIVELSGTALKEDQIIVSNGFYDSIKNAVIFDRTNVSDLEVVQPADTISLNFQIKPDTSIRNTPEVSMVVSARGRRLRESSAIEALVGSETRMVKFASEASLLSSVTYQSGQLPPVAEKLTQYTVSLRVESGSNDLIDGEVTATLPNYVTWLDLSSGDGSLTFSPTSRTILWDVGDVGSNGAATASFTIGFMPSLSQVGEVPTLLSSQSFKATDRFTNTIVRGGSGALTTMLSREAGYEQSDAIVQKTVQTETEIE